MTRWLMCLARVLLWLALVMLVVGALPATAHADKATAESLFQEGQRLMEAGQLEQACPKFQASHEAEPSVGALLNLARCHELSGRNASAWAQYTEAAILAGRTGQTDRQEGALELANKLEPLLSRLTVVVEDHSVGLKVSRNGEVVPRGSWGAALPVDSGTYEVVASAPGKRTFRGRVMVQGDRDAQTLTVPVLADAAEAVETPEAQSRASGLGGLQIGGIVAIAVGAAGLAVGIGFGVVAMNEEKDLESTCPSMQCVGAEKAADDIAPKAHASTAGFVIGGVGLVGGLVLLLVGSSSSGEARVTPIIGPGQAALSVNARF